MVSPTKVWLETKCKGSRLGLLNIFLECLSRYIYICLTGRVYLDTQGKGERLWGRDKVEKLLVILHAGRQSELE